MEKNEVAGKKKTIKTTSPKIEDEVRMQRVTVVVVVVVAWTCGLIIQSIVFIRMCNCWRLPTRYQMTNIAQ